MEQQLRVGVIGDFDPQKTSHPKINSALQHAAEYLSIKVEADWLPTPSFLQNKALDNLKAYDCLWASSGSPFNSTTGMLKAIQRARELSKPFVSTWGGYQHALLEYARNVAGMPQAGHMEEDPNTSYPLLVLTSCPVDNRPPESPLQWGGLKIKVLTATLAHNIYRQTDVEETFNCNFELNPDYQQKLEAAGLKISGISETGKARIVELPGRPFFIGMGFIPQMSSQPGKPHPVIVAFLKAALK